MQARNIPRLFIVLLATIGFAFAQVTPPDTPAGRILQAWLTAFNSGDRAQIDNYVKTYQPDQDAGGLMSFRNQTGGFDLLSAETVDPLHLRFEVKEKNSDTQAIGMLALKAAQPPTVDSLGLRALPPGVKPVNVTLDATMRQKTVDAGAANLTEY